EAVGGIVAERAVERFAARESQRLRDVDVRVRAPSRPCPLAEALRAPRATSGGASSPPPPPLNGAPREPLGSLDSGDAHASGQHGEPLTNPVGPPPAGRSTNHDDEPAGGRRVADDPRHPP